MLSKKNPDQSGCNRYRVISIRQAIMQSAEEGSNPASIEYSEDSARFGIGVGDNYELALSILDDLRTIGRVSLHQKDDGEYLVGVWLDVSEANESYKLMDQLMGEIINLTGLEERLPPNESEYRRFCYGSSVIDSGNEIVAPDVTYPLLVPEEIIGEEAWKEYLNELADDEAEAKQRLLDAPGWSPGTPRTPDDTLRWLIRGLIYSPSVGVLYGPDGELKTFTAIDIAVHVAANTDEWAGLPNE